VQESDIMKQRKISKAVAKRRHSTTPQSKIDSFFKPSGVRPRVSRWTISDSAPSAKSVSTLLTNRQRQAPLK